MVDIAKSRILIVDDNPNNIQVLANTLKVNDFDFEFALTGEAALSWLGKKSFDLILLDLMMPGLDGFETLRLIRKNEEWNQISVIFLTAKSDINALLKGFEIGAQDYLTKPFNPQELLSRVKAHVSMRAHQKLLKTFNSELEIQVAERTEALQESMDLFRELNNSLNNLIASIPGTVFKCLYDEHLTVRYLSPQFYELSGYEPEQLIDNNTTTLSHLIAPVDLVSLKTSIDEHLETNSKINNKIRLMKKSGEYAWLEIRGNCKKEEHEGNEKYVIEGVMNDITGDIALEEILLTTSIQAADKERDYIAKELHDGVQQSLASVALSMQGIPLSMFDQECQGRFSEAILLLNNTIREVRSISHRLAPKAVEDFGLVVAVRDMVNQQNLNSEIRFEFHENIGARRFNEDVERNIYRIIQESVNNIHKYAEAKDVSIQLFFRDYLLTLMVEDDGIGFDRKSWQPEENGYGLLSMESRAAAIGGILEINSAKGRGSQILTEVPIDH